LQKMLGEVIFPLTLMLIVPLSTVYTWNVTWFILIVIYYL
jgi:hypothetical protein